MKYEDNVINIRDYLTEKERRKNSSSNSPEYCIGDITNLVESIALTYISEDSEVEYLLEDAQEDNMLAQARAIQNYKKFLEISGANGPDLVTISKEFNINGKRLEQLLSDVINITELIFAFSSGNIW